MNLKELSDKLGLSPTTVSRALNGYPEVNLRTRQRVEEAAKRHNYAPNSRAKRLATGRSMTIGHLLPMSSEHEMVNPVFADFIAGAGERYTDCGYGLLLSVVLDQNETATYRKLAQNGDVDGFVVHGPKVDDPRIPMLHELGLPFVVHGRSSAVEKPYCWVDVNNRSAFRRATDLLLDLGHRRIALINGIAEMDFVMRRESGFRDAHADRKVELDDALILNAEMNETNGYRSAMALLQHEEPPTGIVISSMISAIGVRRAMSDLALVPGRDVSLVVHDDDLSYFRNDGQVPIYTATRSSVRMAGRLSADMLLKQIEENSDTPEQILLEADLIVGQSTGSVPV